MKKIVAILGVFTIVVVIASLGCLDGSSSAKDMAKMVPEDASTFGHFDLQTMRDDKDLEATYEKMTEGGDDLDVLGLDLDDINHMAVVVGEEEGEYELVIWKGNFDLGDVRDELDDADFDEDEYKDVEIWKKRVSLAEDFAIAISGDTLIIGNIDSVKDCIKVMKGSEKSVYDDNEDFRDVIDRLPEGTFTAMTLEGIDLEGIDLEYEGALAGGAVLMKEDEDTLLEQGVIKFDDEDDAEDAKSELKRDLKEEMDDVEVKQNGEFLEYTGKRDIESSFWETKESTTTIYAIEEHPDDYIGEKVTIEAIPGKSLVFTVEGTYGGLNGFWMCDKERYGSSLISRDIFVAYEGDCPSRIIKDKWGRDTSTTVKVTGIVRHMYVRIGFEDVGVFYIDGVSWDYVD